MRDSGQVEQELKRVREERKKLAEQRRTYNNRSIVVIIIGLIILLLFFFGCTPKQEDYRFEVTKVVIVNNCQVVIFANKITHYTLWLPLRPKYEVGDTIETNDRQR